MDVNKYVGKLIYCVECFAYECEACFIKALNQGTRGYKCARSCINTKWWYDGKTNHKEFFTQFWQTLLELIRQLSHVQEINQERKALLSDLTQDMSESMITFT